MVKTKLRRNLWDYLGYTLTNSLVLATLSFALIPSLEAVAITTATRVPEGGTGLLCIIVEPGRGITIAFSRLGRQRADGVGLKEGETRRD